MKARFSATMVMACLLGAFLFPWMGRTIPEPGTDFNQFYAAGKLAGTGQLYNFERIQELERPHKQTLVPFGRLPFYAAVFKVFTLLPYGWARIAWGVVNLAALGAFALLWPAGRRQDLLMTLCWSCPAALLISMGQDTGLYLLVFTVGLLLLQANRDFAAGLVFSLCAAKFHLALGIPVFLVARRRWPAIWGGLTGGVVQLAVSFAVEGRGWPEQLRRLSAISEFSPVPYKMPNLYGLVYRLPDSAGLEIFLAALVLAAVWRISRSSDLPIGATAALAGGLLTGHHAYVYDSILLVPLLVLVRQLSVPKVIRYWSVLLTTPVPYILLMRNPDAAFGQVLIAGFCLVSLALLLPAALPSPACYNEVSLTRG
jgi:Glycosyltransferase family 87